jgi:N-acetylmuramoyl-L-alanine amidase
VVGALAIRVVYPGEGQQLAARDSNFIFGSVGSGEAALSINGTPVPVAANGAFLAFLPVPPAARPSYELVATQGADTARLTLRVGLPAPRVALPETGPLVVDSASLAPRPRLATLRWEPVRVSIRAPRSASLELQLADGARLPLVRADLSVPNADSNLWSTEAPAVRLNSPAWIAVVRGADSLRLPLPRVALADSAGPQYAVVGASPPAVPDTDRVIIGRPIAGGTYKWFLIPGTVVEVTGRVGDAARIRLAADLDVYVDPNELRPLPSGSTPPARVANNARVAATAEWSDVRIPMAAVPPYTVDVEPDALVLTLLGTTANTDIINFTSGDSVIRRVTWRQISNTRAEYRIELQQPPFGYLVMWEGNAVVLRVRKPPRPRAQRPLDGLTIAVDAGHPPAGTTGPTGLYEPVPALAIAERLKTYLEQRGARVVMTRTAPGAVPLSDRPVMARRANAHAFVSIHLNAFPDGVNPFTSNGTGSYYFNAYSEPLAREVQKGMVRRLGLRDLGVYYDNLAVLRPTWMPSVLCEGAFLMLPEQEAALRTPEFQDAYARGVSEGVEAYFRTWSRP